MNSLKWTIRRLTCAALLLVLAGCALPPAQPGVLPATPGANAAVQPALLRSEKPRSTGPVAPADLQMLAAGNNAFAVDLYRQLAVGEGNRFFSPYSISLALAMAQAGARGNTLAEMNRVMHYDLPVETQHPAFNALDQELAARKETQGKGADGKGFRLNIVNDLWGQKDYAFQPAYLDLLAANYGAGMRIVDFTRNAEGARLAINDYIARQTEQRIKDLLAQGAVDERTRLVLTNAIYFNAAWANPFDEQGTQEMPFTRLDGSTTPAPMMRVGAHSLQYLAGEGFQAAALPYEGRDIAMLVLLPEAGGFADFEAGLGAAQLEEILTGLEQNYQEVAVKMPRFEMENEFKLGQTLAGMGMKDATTFGAADFSGMDGTRDLFISEVIHKSFVKVDEQGTEAAAATAVIAAAGAMPGEPINLVLDRPFVFLIVDRPTRTVLFMGRVVDPGLR